MHRIDVATAASTPPPRQEAGAPGYFTNGNAIAGKKATIPGADWFNTVQAELANTVEGTGQELQRDDDTQLLQAIRALIRKARHIPGEILVFAGASAPDGTLACDGNEVSRSIYPDLFAAIGTTYGAGDGTSTFQLPMFRHGETFRHAAGEVVGRRDPGGVILHNHDAAVDAQGAHGHGASTDAQGWHGHGASTDVQGHHGHNVSIGGDGNHTHQYGSPALDNFQHGRVDQTAIGPGGSQTTSVAGWHGHAAGTDGAGSHAHNVSIAGDGWHTHNIGIDVNGSHAHNVRVGDAGHDANYAAGLNMLFCIAY